jgi:hypothetical protein
VIKKKSQKKNPNKMKKKKLNVVCGGRCGGKRKYWRITL